jgi:hypothetical protein
VFGDGVANVKFRVDSRVAFIKVSSVSATRFATAFPSAAE